MSRAQHGRQYDMVVFGATGYTGVWTAEQIAVALPTDISWAIAGRSQEKLAKLAAVVKAKNPDRRQPAIEVCSLDDESLASLAKKTFILLATVGPYARYGEHAFKACAQNGTHYLDVTGELPWTFEMIQKYDGIAKSTGAIIIPQIGIESAPTDLFAFSMTKAIREELRAPTRDGVLAVDMIGASPSGGTLATVFNMFEQYKPTDIMKASKPFALSPAPNPSPPFPETGLLAKVTGLVNFPIIGLATTSLAGRVNTAIVERTWGLFRTNPARKDDFYGPNFTFAEYSKARNPLRGVVMHLAIVLGTLLITLLPPLRKLAQRFVEFQPGEGPTKERAAKEKVEFRGVAKPDLAGSNKLAYCTADFQGGMYHLTAILLAHGAQTILEEYENLGLKGGVCTPACLGQPFIDRLSNNGFKIETKIVTA